LRKAVDETGWAIGEGGPGEAFKSGRPLFKGRADFRPHTPEQPYVHLAIEAGLNLVAFLPVLVGNEVVAVLLFATTEAVQPDAALLDVMADIGLQLGRVVERKRIEDARRESEEKFRQIAERSFDLIYTLEAHGTVTYVSPAVKRLLLQEPDDVIGRDFAEFMTEGDVLRARHYFAEGAMGEERGVVDYGLVRKDGRPVFVECAASPIMKEGVFVGSQGIIRDVTDRREAEVRLHEAETRLAHVARLSTMGEMMASIAHEVNQPLYAIRNFTRAAQNVLDGEGQPALADLREWHDAIAKAADRAGDIVKRMRRFARRDESVHRSCRINEVIQESAQLVTFEARRHQAAIRLELPDSSPLVNVDRVQIQQVLVNLLRNAFEAMDEPDNQAREVTLRVESAGESIQVSVTDTGPGLPAHADLDVFEPFATTKQQGLGMGLAISSSIVEAHDGRLWADSPAAGGAAFHFTLPAFQKESTDGV